MHVLHTGDKADSNDQRYKRSGRFVRLIYSVLVLTVIGYMCVYFGRPYLILEGVGTVSAPSRAVSLAFVADVVLVHVHPGDKVYPGSLLVTVNRSDYETVLQETNTALVDREADIDKVRRELHVANRLAPVFKRRVEELRDILDKTDTRPETLDLSTRSTLHREYSDASVEFENNLAQRAELPALLAKLEEHRSQLKIRQAQVAVTWKNHRLIGDQVGIVSSKVVSEGDTVLAGEAMMQIFDPTRRYILWELPETMLRLPLLGEQVVIKTTNTTVTGQVDQFAAVREPSSSEDVGGTHLVYVAVDEDDFKHLPLQSSVTVRMNYFF